jgi:homoserine dehydrogenase
VKGYDPKFKLAIAITHAFGVFVKPEHVINIGIDRISELDLKFARENGYTIKLIARAFKAGNKVFGFVAPQFIEATNPLASVRNEYNAVQVQGAFAEKQTFIGKGAGSYPTGSAVLSDIGALTYQYAYEYKKLQQVHDLVFSNELVTDAYISFDNGTPIAMSDFEEFQTGYAANGKHYMAGKVTLEKLSAWSKIDGVGIILAPKAGFIPQLEYQTRPALSVA